MLGIHRARASKLNLDGGGVSKFAIKFSSCNIHDFTLLGVRPIRFDFFSSLSAAG